MFRTVEGKCNIGSRLSSRLVAGSVGCIEQKVYSSVEAVTKGSTIKAECGSYEEGESIGIAGVRTGDTVKAVVRDAIVGAKDTRQMLVRPKEVVNHAAVFLLVDYSFEDKEEEDSPGGAPSTQP